MEPVTLLAPLGWLALMGLVPLITMGAAIESQKSGGGGGNAVVAAVISGAFGFVVGSMFSTTPHIFVIVSVLGSVVLSVAMNTKAPEQAKPINTEPPRSPVAPLK